MAGYTGFKVTPSGSSASVDQLKVADATPERFWKDYVSQRKPVGVAGQLSDTASCPAHRQYQGYTSDPGVRCPQVLLDGLLTDSSWKAGEKWTNAYLAEHAVSVHTAPCPRTHWPARAYPQLRCPRAIYRASDSRAIFVWLPVLQGSCDLRVEVRPDTSEHFGRGIKTDVTFKDFLSRMDAADETLYLTTQKVPVYDVL